MTNSDVSVLLPEDVMEALMSMSHRWGEAQDAIVEDFVALPELAWLRTKEQLEKFISVGAKNAPEYRRIIERVNARRWYGAEDGLVRRASA